MPTPGLDEGPKVPRGGLERGQGAWWGPRCPQAGLGP